MSKTIEIIEGVAYAVIRARECYPCAKCALYGTAHNSPCSKYNGGYYYRHLTAEERTGIIKAMERGI